MSNPQAPGDGGPPAEPAARPDQLRLAGMPTGAGPRSSSAGGRPAARRSRSAREVAVADELPVAEVLVDVSLPHLDRPFDYLVPAAMAADAVPGARVSVRFAGADHGGFVLRRLAASDHGGRLSPLRRVVSAEPVLTAEIAELARAVADRYAGTAADVIRLAVPPRHAATERQPSPQQAEPPPQPEPAAWGEYRGGAAFLGAVAGGGHPRAVWTPRPGADWADVIARLVASAVASDRGAVVVAPDGRDVAAIDRALTALVGEGQHVVLGAELGPAERYRRWLAVRRGAVRAVVGTRSAAFAPVGRLGLVCVWDDGNDLHAEPRAPYPHMREVVLLRAHLNQAAAVVGGFARTAEAEHLVASGWAGVLEPDRTTVRAAAPRIRATGDDHAQARDPGARGARLPTLAWQTARDGLARGPVLVQVPRDGYVPAVACAGCRTAARCASCSGPMAVGSAGQSPRCRVCGADAWRCPQCGDTRVRAITVGVRRTAEELGRAFPGTTVLLSRADQVRDVVPAEPALVMATPGAEPVAPGGYAAALLLDAMAMLARPGLRVAEEALRRWFRAATLVRPATEGGQVVVVADSAVPAVQALVRWDPGGFAARELAERSALRFPPAARVARLEGAAADVTDLLRQADLPDGAEVLGPAPGPDADTVAAVVRVPRSAGVALAAGLRAAAGVRSARRRGQVVRIQIDPLDVG